MADWRDDKHSGDERQEEGDSKLLFNRQEISKSSHPEHATVLDIRIRAVLGLGAGVRLKTMQSCFPIQDE